MFQIMIVAVMIKKNDFCTPRGVDVHRLAHPFPLPSKQRELPSYAFCRNRVDPEDFCPDLTSLGHNPAFFAMPMPQTLVVHWIIVSTQQHRSGMLVQNF